MKYIGMDIHKTSTMISWVDEANVVLPPFKIPTEKESLRQFASAVAGSAKVAIEATRNHAFIHDLLAAAGLEVVVSHPKHTAAICASKKKNDRHDARTLAKLLQADLLTVCYMPPLEVRLLRELVREHLRLTAIMIRARNWIRATLAQHGLVCRFRDIAGPGGRAWLEAAEMHPIRRQAIQRDLELIAVVQEQVEAVQQQIFTQVKDDPAIHRLVSLPGVGYLLAAAILAEIGEVRRFASDRRLASYAGLVTTTRESAGVVRHGHITKEGSAVLRWALSMAVTHLVRKPGPLKQFYLRVAEKHGKKSARTATARKLARVIFAMLTQQTGYDPSHFTQRRREVEGSAAVPSGSLLSGIGQAR